MKFVDENDLDVSFPYLDNVTICSKDQEDHDTNMEHFLEAAKCNLCYNTEKCIFSTQGFPVFRYTIKEGSLYGQILIVYDPCMNSPFHTTHGP